MSTEAFAAWCAEVAAGFRGHEHATQDPYRKDRDQALIEYAVGALAGAGRQRGTHRGNRPAQSHRGGGVSDDEQCPVCGNEGVDWAERLRDLGYDDEDIEKLRKEWA